MRHAIKAILCLAALAGAAMMDGAGAPAAAQCRSGPGHGVAGKWWRYRVDHGRHCWYLGQERRTPRRARPENAHASAGPALPRQPHPATTASPPAAAPPDPIAAERVAAVFGPDGDPEVKAAADQPKTMEVLAQLSGGSMSDAMPAVPTANCPVWRPESAVRPQETVHWIPMLVALALCNVLWIMGLWWIGRRQERAAAQIEDELDAIHQDGASWRAEAIPHKHGHNDLGRWEEFGGTLKRPPPPSPLSVPQ